MWPLTNGLRCLAGAEAALLRGCVGMMVDGLVADLNSDPMTELAAESADWDSDELLEGFGFSPPAWYAMWEPEQRVWLLERVTTSLLAARTAPPHSAIFEATIEAIYVELADLIAMEITTGTPIERGSWRASLLDAYVQRCPEDSLRGGLHFEATTLDPCVPPAISRQWHATQADGESTTNCEPSDDAVSQSPASQTNGKKPGESDWMTWWMSVIERLVDATYGPRLYHAAERYRDDDPKLLQRYLQSKGVNEKFTTRIPPLRSRGQTQAAIDRLQSIVFQDE